MYAQGPYATTPYASTSDVSFIIPEVVLETKELVLVIEIDLLKPAES